MGAGQNSTQRPLNVPIGAAHTRVTENVRRPATGFRLGSADDLDQTVHPSDGHSVFYDSVSGLYKVALAPPTMTFNQTGALTVTGSDQAPTGGAGKLVVVAAYLTTAGSSTTTAVLTKNASTVVTTFTFASSSNTATYTALANTSFVAGDRFWLNTTAAGTGAKGLVISMWATAP